MAASKSENGLVNVRVNNYMTRTQFEDQYGPTVPKPKEINNQFVSVEEIFKTCLFLDIVAEHIHGIIFVFKSEEFLNNLNEGSRNIFCI